MTEILVPIQVEALVIDRQVIDDMSESNPDWWRTLGGGWSPQGADSARAVYSLKAMGPHPFFDGSIPEDPEARPSPGTAARPRETDRGVYLHWVLPTGLRRAYRRDTEAPAVFPALPDQWLVVRFARDSTRALLAKAWYVDAGVRAQDADETGSAELIYPVDSTNGDYAHAAVRVGRVVPLEEATAGGLQGPRFPVTAVGSRHAGSPTFSAFVADNRNILSWHDDLKGYLHDALLVPQDLVLSYLVLGWYRTAGQDVLASLRRLLTGDGREPGAAGSVLEALGWQVDSRTAAGNRVETDPTRSLFHGMVAHINYWDKERYKGPRLGYPHAWPAHREGQQQPKPFQVGIGHSASDAVVALVAEHASAHDKDSREALWKALEAVVYRQGPSLLQGWQEASREFAVHQSWFTPVNAGQRWTVTAEERDPNSMQVPGVPAEARTASLQLSGRLLADLQQLNGAQIEVNGLARELAAAQNELYAHWWRMVQGYALVDDSLLDQGRRGCARLAPHVGELQRLLQARVIGLDRLRAQLEAALKQHGLLLQAEAAARFWLPADPVLVVRGIGHQDKHQFPDPLPCRTPHQLTCAVKVDAHDNTTSWDRPQGVDEIAGHIDRLESEVGQLLIDLVNEGSLVEPAMSQLAAGVAVGRHHEESWTENQWKVWRETVEAVITAEDTDERWRFSIRAQGADGSVRAIGRLASFWGQQPWSPLFLDWQITYYPDQTTGRDLAPGWVREDFDYAPDAGEKSGPEQGYRLRGRSPLSPLLGRFFTDPIDELIGLLEGHANREGASADMTAQLAAILSLHVDAWRPTLRAMEREGLLGQALSGLHQALLGRNPALPRVLPEPDHPWLPADGSPDYHDGRMVDYLKPPVLGRDGQTLALPGLAPPQAKDPGDLPFSLLRAGSLTVDELWIVDDFGQWVDLLGEDSQDYLVHSPHSNWPGQSDRIALPPRFLQPARLDFRFVAASGGRESDGGPDTNPVCGWVFHNYLDQALTLCDQDGRLLGELILVDAADDQVSVRWECLAEPQPDDVEVTGILDPTLRAFARELVDPIPRSRQKLQDLLALVDDALGGIRSGSTGRFAGAGRLLALVNARAGLQLFGQTWRDPQSGESNRQLEGLRLPVRFGHGPLKRDGLIGVFYRTGRRLDRIIPGHGQVALGEGNGHTGYVGHPDEHVIEVSFGGSEQVTLLMDPYGVVHASAGVLPAKAVSLPAPYLARAQALMELSFAVGPVLVPTMGGETEAGDAPASRPVPLPLPGGVQEQWQFHGPRTGAEQRPAVPPDPVPTYDFPPLAATEGRLVLRPDNTES